MPGQLAGYAGSFIDFTVMYKNVPTLDEILIKFSREGKTTEQYFAVVLLFMQKKSVFYCTFEFAGESHEV